MLKSYSVRPVDMAYTNNHSSRPSSLIGQ